MSTSSTTSPFRIAKEDEEELARNEAFRSVQQRLERSEQKGAFRSVTRELGSCP